MRALVLHDGQSRPPRPDSLRRWRNLTHLRALQAVRRWLRCGFVGVFHAGFSTVPLLPLLSYFCVRPRTNPAPLHANPRLSCPHRPSVGTEGGPAQSHSCAEQLPCCELAPGMCLGGGVASWQLFQCLTACWLHTFTCSPEPAGEEHHLRPRQQPHGLTGSVPVLRAAMSLHERQRAVS